MFSSRFHVFHGTALPSYREHKDAFILIPPTIKREEITEYLDVECEKIYWAIELIKNKIQKLQEFKTRLISDVVAGKIDVRGIDIPAFEYTAKEADTDSEAEAEELDEQEGEM